MALVMVECSGGILNLFESRPYGGDEVDGHLRVTFLKRRSRESDLEHAVVQAPRSRHNASLLHG
jgi:hypothetical protein